MKKVLWPFITVCSLVLSISLGQGAHADVVTTHDIPVKPLTPAELSHREQLWQDVLTKVAKKENTPLVIRVNPMNQVIKPII